MPKAACASIAVVMVVPMPDNRLRLVAGPPLRAALAATGNEYPTGRVNAVAERYLAMIEAVRPVFGRQEWLAIFDALNGVGHDDFRAGEDAPRVPAWAGIAAEIIDARGLGEHWGIDQAALARKVHALPEPARIAIVETAQRFWALCDLPDSEALHLATSHPATWP